MCLCHGVLDVTVLRLLAIWEHAYASAYGTFGRSHTPLAFF